MKPKEEQLHIAYKKISANGNTDKKDIDGLSPGTSPDLASQLLMELKNFKKTRNLKIYRDTFFYFKRKRIRRCTLAYHKFLELL